jgi:DHA1 family bicyclomycin/chloramphenicol resistance-like MFS transporter
LSAFQFGVAYAAACGGSLVGGAIAASLVVRMGLTMTIGLGAVTLTLGGIAMMASLALGSAPVVSLVLSMAVYHSGLMIAMPLSIAGAMTPFPNSAGTAGSFVGSVQQISAALVGVVVGRALGSTAWPLATAIASMGMLSLMFWAALLWLHTRGALLPKPSHTIAEDVEPIS